MQVHIIGTNLPGAACGCRPDGGTYQNIHVGIGSRGQAVELVRGDATSARWVVDVRVVVGDDGSYDFRGPFVDGKRGDRFIYLNWVAVDPAGTFELFRRAKLGLSTVEPTVIERALAADALTARIDLTDARGNPRCATVRSPDLVWTA